MSKELKWILEEVMPWYSQLYYVISFLVLLYLILTDFSVDWIIAIFLVDIATSLFFLVIILNRIYLRLESIVND